ncbi:DUF2017 family protein [Leucobacter ruminantium]|uniref:DUF2017 family protein n=1 Tax=Leucobacter ruminantium TaxID=1289170 RepID=A0A939RZ90_9MICO|nr:DUF2017 family protein [Leucobacter ruminantium]MBO1805626.1 DUF2017 family protein [Leucobacter ruminantium]
MMVVQPPEGGLRMVLQHDEAAMLNQLVTQLVQLLQSHSSTALDPDPLFASLEVGGSDAKPEDPALARLFPDAYEGDDESGRFRQVTEQGILNRKLQDALEVTSALGLGGDPFSEADVEVELPSAALPAWARTLTALRLAIAARIGLEHESDHARLEADEETRGTVLVFDWLAAILDTVMRVQLADLDRERAEGEGSGGPGDEPGRGGEGS